MSKIVIGNGLKILKPAKEGNWSGMPVLSSPEPCLNGEKNWLPHTPEVFPESLIE